MKTSIRVTDELRKDVNEYAELTDRNFSQALRYLVRKGLDAEAAERKRKEAEIVK